MPAGQQASSAAAKDLRPPFALGRWQKAVSVALMVSKTGNSGGLHQYIKSGKNKHGLIKVRQKTYSSPQPWDTPDSCLEHCGLHVHAEMTACDCNFAVHPCFLLTLRYPGPRFSVRSACALVFGRETSFSSTLSKFTRRKNRYTVKPLYPSRSVHCFCS